MQKKSEQELQNKIRLELSRRGWCVFRVNVGGGRLANGSYFETGVPNGFSDLFAVKDGKAIFIECKVKPNRPTEAQLRFIDMVSERYGCPAGVCYSVEEAVKLCEKSEALSSRM